MSAVNEVCQDDVAALEAVLTGSYGVAVAAEVRHGGGGGRSCRRSRRWDHTSRDPGTATASCRIGPSCTAGGTPGYDAVGGAYPMQGCGAELRAMAVLGPRLRDHVRWAHPPRVRSTPARSTPGQPTLGRPPSPSVRHTWPAAAPAIARAQCAYLLGTAIPAVRARAGSAPVILGGDLNLRSDDSPAAVACLPRRRPAGRRRSGPARRGDAGARGRVAPHDRHAGDRPPGAARDALAQRCR